jgi:glutamate--cysteine ligase
VIFQGERPLHALRERGVEYVEVRLMDLDPFEPVGINSQTIRFLDMFLAYCLGTDSPLDTPEEIIAIAQNQQRVAERGREPGLQLQRGSARVSLTDWGLELVQALEPIARQFDAAYNTQDYTAAVQVAVHGLQQPETLPSARVLQVVQQSYAGSFLGFIQAQSARTKAAMLQTPLAPGAREKLEVQSRESLQAQQDIEAADTMPFDIYLAEYLSPRRLRV